MVARDVVGFSAEIATVLGALCGAVFWGAKSIHKRRAAREQADEDAIVSDIRCVVDQHHAPAACFDPEMNSEEYRLCERLVAKGKLARGHFGFRLPD
jgi:hypothetical protein